MSQPYARVVCSTHGPVGLTEVQYVREMDRPNSRWCCPRCGDIANFDDEFFEEQNRVDEEDVS